MRGVLPGARKPNVAGELTQQPRQAVAVGEYDRSLVVRGQLSGFA